MTETKIDLILHPIRIRILITIGTQEMTAQQLARALPDVAQATLYRHIKTLAEGDILQVVDENPVRGTVEKVYALAEGGGSTLTAEELANLSKEDHMRYFTTFALTLVQQFARFLQSRDKVDPAVDGLGYHTRTLYMSDEELQLFGQDLSQLLHPYLEPTDNKSRSPHLFSTVFIPSDKSDTQID